MRWPDININVNINVNGVPEHRHQFLPLKTFGPVSEQHLPGPEKHDMGVAVLTDTQKVDVSYGKFEGVDAKGSKAALQAGSLVWKSSDETVAKVTAVSEDPINGTIVAGLAGVCEVWPEVDGDTTDGVKTLQGEHIAVQVTGGVAVGLGGTVVVGTPVEQ